MKLKLLPICILLLALTSRVQAAHIFATDLLYTHVSGKLYKVTLTVFADCSNKFATSPTIDQLPFAAPVVYIQNNGNTLLSRALKLQGNAVEVSPVCTRMADSTACRFGTLPGILKFVYEDTVTIPYNSANWGFVFDAELGNWRSQSYVAGRSSNINNIANPGSSRIRLEALLDNTAGPNSSPQYNTIPTPFYCVNADQQYNQGAADPDADSLLFTLVPGMNVDPTSHTFTYATYLAGYSPTDPIHTASGSVSYNTLNGQLSFNPDIVQYALVVSQVTEYRGGKVVGTSMREMTFIIRADCGGPLPSPYISSITGATAQNGTVISICKGNPNVAFTISFSNPNADRITVKPYGAPAGASLSVVNDSTTDPTVNFAWNTTGLATGVYSFTLAYDNNRCPLQNRQSIAYTIRVANPPVISASILFPTQCLHQALVQYRIDGGYAPRTILVTQSGTVIKRIPDNSNVDTVAYVRDSLPPGSYTLYVVSDSICTGVTTLTVVDSGTLPVNIPDMSLCLNDPAVAFSFEPVKADATVNWYNSDGTSISGPPTVSTSNVGTYTWFVEEFYKTCSSGRVPVKAVVHSLPVVSFIDKPEAICYGDKVFLSAAGAVNYTWLPAEIIAYEKGRAFFTAYTPTTISVIGKDANNCSDTTQSEFGNIQDCCNFTYPSAFTPNNDGRNDGWRVVTYGNMKDFELRIFNRFGQLVFKSSDPKERWDGTFNGQDCDLGTYYFYLEARCLTGPYQFRGGDIHLIR